MIAPGGTSLWPWRGVVHAGQAVPGGRPGPGAQAAVRRQLGGGVRVAMVLCDGVLYAGLTTVPAERQAARRAARAAG